MSRIKDALKEVEKKQSNQPPGGIPPLTPATGRTAGGIGWVLPVIIWLLLLAAGIFIGLAFVKRAAEPKTAVPVAGTPVVPAPAVPVVQLKPVQPAPVAVVTPPTNSIHQTNPVAVVIKPPPSPPPLKLQGIGADPKNPWAVLNGKTIFVGDSVGDFRVTEISGQTVTMKKSDGTVKTLSLPE